MSLAPYFGRPPRAVIGDTLAALPSAVPESLRRELQSLAARLSEFEGHDVMPQAGCQVERMTLGSADVLVEFECEPESGDGWNEPHYDASVIPLQVFINGAWCDIGDVVPEATATAWSVEVQQRWADEADAAKAEAAEAARDWS